MVTYGVTVDVEPGLAAAVKRYMREGHIPAIFATGCFARIYFERASATRFRTRYQAARPEDIERYVWDHTARLRADFAARFPTGAAVAREVWTARQGWPS